MRAKDLKILRCIAGLTQGQLASRTGLSEIMISLIERGHSQISKKHEIVFKEVFRDIENFSTKDLLEALGRAENEKISHSSRKQAN